MRLLQCATALALCHGAFAATPVVRDVVNGADFQPVIASSTWITITGTNLSSSTRDWGGKDLAGGILPTELDGVRVLINGKPASIAYVSPTQINALTPEDSEVGMVSVAVINGLGTSNRHMAHKQAVAPALFATAGRATPGKTLALHATGLGSAQVQVTIGGQPARVQSVQKISPGVHQVNVLVPALPRGQASVVIAAAGVASTGKAFVSVQDAPPLTDCLTGPVDSITYSVNRLNFGQPDEASIGGTKMCAKCDVKPPLYPEFAERMELALRKGKAVQACFDSKGMVFELRLMQPY